MSSKSNHKWGQLLLKSLLIVNTWGPLLSRSLPHNHNIHDFLKSHSSGDAYMVHSQQQLTTKARYVNSTCMANLT
eukprot:jgi/Botrbrau1/12864/Bobra.0188s0007.1